MSIEVRSFITGPIETNTYIVSNQKKACCIVDPSSGCEEALRHIDSVPLRPEAIILTHGHFDHILGIPEMIRRFPDVAIWVHPLDREFVTNPDRNDSFMMGSDYVYTGSLHDLTEGIMIIGSFKCTVLHIPGHTPGGCALIFEGHCLSGDSLFAGSVGRTDFEYGNGDLLIQGIKMKLLSLPDNTIVHPGHMGRTTIGREKRMNPFLQE